MRIKKKKYFGTDGIRGKANTSSMNASLALNVAQNMNAADEAKNKDLPQFSIEALKTKVSCHKQRNYESLNYKFLTECLREYFQQDQTIEQSEEKAKDVLLYIRQKRGYEEKMILKRDRLH